jgi:glycosyltransferase involved in cell wall biosynthesis
MLAANFLKGELARKSVHWADQTVAPSQAFAHELRRWTGREVAVIHHGFNPQTFFSDVTPPPADIQQKLDQTDGCLRLLFVSHYNYYRNFETLLRALPLIQNLMPEKRVKLFLTCNLEQGANPGAYNGASAGRLVERLGIATSVVQLGAVPYASLHHLYRACDLYVTPAYAETFAHPLVEAMASGLPVVASDLPVHKEVCGDAALYFPRFSPEALAEAVVRIACSSDLAAQLSAAGKERSSHFSWAEHVHQLLGLVTQGRLVDSHQEKIAALSAISRAS